MAEPSQKRVFRFGVYEAEVATGELRKSGLKLRLQEQPFQVLVMLLERPGELVTREEIRQKLWSDDTFVDFDHSLNTVINKLREALGDSAANPRFIETLARRGYRFIAPVETIAGAAPGPEQDKAMGAAPAAAELASASTQESAPIVHAAEAEEIPTVPRGLVRLLFSLIQVMYLVFYIVSLAKLGDVENRLAQMVPYPHRILVLLVVTAVVGIPMRLYLLSAASFNYQGLGRKFQRLFLCIFLLDELWALAPFLIRHRIGFGLAFAATAALVYVPFAQRTLMRMGYHSLGRG